MLADLRQPGRMVDWLLLLMIVLSMLAIAVSRSRNGLLSMCIGGIVVAIVLHRTRILRGTGWPLATMVTGPLLVGPTYSDKLGRKLTEIENIIAGAMHPEHLAQRPAIVGRVLEPATVKVAVHGAVENLGVVKLATVFRKDADDQIVPVTFEISNLTAVKAAGVAIRPGDVIVIEHTAGSWTRSFIATVFRAQMNFFVDPLGR